MKNAITVIAALCLVLPFCTAVADESESAAPTATTGGGDDSEGPAGGDVSETRAGSDDSEGPVAALEGAWLVDEITVISTRGEASYPDPQPGIYIFSGGHYSMVWSWSLQPLPDSEEIWRPSEEEKARSFSSLIVNSGTYTVSDTLVTTYPMVAKTPEFAGGMASYRYRVVADTLWMEVTNTVSHSGVVDPGVGKVRMPIKLVRP